MASSTLKSVPTKPTNCSNVSGAHNHIDPNELVKNLTVGEQQIVEIAKALAIDAHILIMDEPSAVLPSRDMDRLYEVVRACEMRAAGLFISHTGSMKYFELADRVTVLKDGKTMGTKNIAETNNDELVHIDGWPRADRYVSSCRYKSW